MENIYIIILEFLKLANCTRAHGITGFEYTFIKHLRNLVLTFAGPSMFRQWMNCCSTHQAIVIVLCSSSAQTLLVNLATIFHLTFSSEHSWMNEELKQIFLKNHDGNYKFFSMFSGFAKTFQQETPRTPQMMRSLV